MGFYYEIDSWKEIPMHKTFALTEASSFSAAVIAFDEKEKHAPSFVVKELGKPRYWMPAIMEEWSPDELVSFKSNLRRVG